MPFWLYTQLRDRTYPPPDFLEVTVNRSSTFTDTTVGPMESTKFVQFIIAVTLVLTLIVIVVSLFEPGVGIVVALTLSMLLLVWIYLIRILFRTRANLGSIIKNIQFKNHELIDKVKVAEETCRVKSQFLASMSHEIRTPLSAILGFVELLDDPNLSTDEHIEYLHIVKSNSHYLINVVNDILDISHLNSGKLTIEPRPTNVSEVLSSILTMLQLKADEKGLELSLKYLSKVPSVIMIDESRLRQIVINLVSNAIKFTAVGTVKIHVGCHLMDQVDFVNLEIIVCDSGIGINPEESDKLFNMFSQLDNGYVCQARGSGLGLAISKSLANMMGGDVALLGSIPGKGSSFVFNCPAAVVKAFEAPETDILNHQEVIFEPFTIHQ
jgi:signal transduction histidine kinase